jgi:relaxase-like protein
MISKGTTHNNGAKLAAYMTTGKDGEKAELWQLRGFEATNIKDAFRDVQIMAGATKAEQPFFHVQVRNREGETLTRQQFEYAADRIERMLGLTGQPRAITFHTYEHNNDQHMHVAWSRIDQDTLTAIPLPFFKERLKKISRELEMHFGLEPVTNHREGQIKFAPTRGEHEQARRLGLDVHEVRNTIRECWDRSDCGRSFQAALEHEGMALAQGERRDFVVIDRAGGMHVLGKRILDVTASKIRDRLSDISREQLPSVEMARALMPERTEERASEKTKQQEKPEQAWDRDRDDRVWHEAVINAAIDKEKAERNFVEPEDKKSQRQKRRAGAGNRKEIEWPIMPPPPAPIRTSPQYHFEDAARATARQIKEAPEQRAEQRVAHGNATRREKETAVKPRARIFAKGTIRGAVKFGKAAGRTIGKTLDAVSNAFESLFAPTLTPQQKHQGEIAAHRREAEAEDAIDFQKYTAHLAHQRQQQENEREAARQRDRERGGRDR